MAVFVAAIADYLCQIARFPEDRLDHRKIAGVEREAKDPSILRNMLRYAEPRPDDDAGDRRTIQNVADADIGDAHPMFVRSSRQHPEQFLEQGPPAPCVDHVLVLLQRGGAEFGPPWLGAAQIFLREQTAEEGAIGEKRNRVFAAERSHPDLGPAIDERILNLVRDDADVIGYYAETLGIEIR